MKVAVFSDVQANIQAFEAVTEHIKAWSPDLVVMDGDLVNRGPDSLACLDHFERLAQDRGWLPTRGNHEDYVLFCGRNSPESPRDRLLRAFTDWTSDQLARRAESMANWPDHVVVQGPAGDWLHVTHGTLAGNRDGILPNAPDESLPGRLPEDVALFITAHTHRPLQREFNGTRIVNVGSVGSPFDGDPRASYGQFEFHGGAWHTRIVRVAYDRDAACRAYGDSGYLEAGGPLARLIFEEWQRAHLLMPFFRRQYMPLIQSGDVALEDAVQSFLSALD